MPSAKDRKETKASSSVWGKTGIYYDPWYDREEELLASMAETFEGFHPYTQAFERKLNEQKNKRSNAAIPVDAADGGEQPEEPRYFDCYRYSR